MLGHNSRRRLACNRPLTRVRGRPRFTDPEILRSSLAGVILRMKSLHLGTVEEFPFLEPPPKKEKAGDVFGLTRVWQLHLEVPAKEWKAMEPAGGFRFPGAPGGNPEKPAPKPGAKYPPGVKPPNPNKKLSKREMAKFLTPDVRAKLRLAQQLGSSALRGDGVLSLAGAALAAATLVSLVVESALGWWWATQSRRC